MNDRHVFEQSEFCIHLKLFQIKHVHFFFAHEFKQVDHSPIKKVDSVKHSVDFYIFMRSRFYASVRRWINVHNNAMPALINKANPPLLHRCQAGKGGTETKRQQQRPNKCNEAKHGMSQNQPVKHSLSPFLVSSLYGK